MKDVDLPEPQWTAEELKEGSVQERRWNVFRALVIFSGLYSFLHKILIPLGLSFTTLKHSPYALIDIFGFIYVSASIRTYFKKQFEGSTSNILFGAVLGKSVWDLWAVFTQQYKGWLTISALVSALPLFLCSFYLLTAQSPFHKILYQKFLVGFVFVLALSALWHLHDEKLIVENSSVLSSEIQKNKICGTKVTKDEMTSKLNYHFKYCSEVP